MPSFMESCETYKIYQTTKDKREECLFTLNLLKGG